MHRRSLLKWISGCLAACCAALVALPGGRYLWSTIRRQKESRSLVRRVVRLADLPPGQPREFVLYATLRDAWTTHPQQPAGRVWLVRSPAAEPSPEKASVLAFSAVCPHLGCTVQAMTHAPGYFCPCHRASFTVTGERVPVSETGEANPSPRSLDSLTCRVVRAEADGDWWVEVEYEEYIIGKAEKVAKA